MLHDLGISSSTLGSILTDNPDDTLYFRYTREPTSGMEIRQGDIVAADFKRPPAQGDLVVMERGRNIMVGVWQPPYLIDEHANHARLLITRDMRIIAVVSGFARRMKTGKAS